MTAALEAFQRSTRRRRARETARPRLARADLRDGAASSCSASRFEVDVDAESALDEIIGGYDAIVVRSATKLTAD